MEMPVTGMLREGGFGNIYIVRCANGSADGIHIDMDHLKKGEVK